MKLLFHCRVKLMVKAIFYGLCPNCMGPIASTRLEKGLPCTACLPSKKARSLSSRTDRFDHIIRVAKLIEKNRVGAYSYLSNIITELKSFEKLFSKAVGKKMWSLQRTWALRLLSGESFAITAPTGVGKTTLLLTYAVYQAKKGRKVYILVPTDSLVVQAEEKMRKLVSNIGDPLTEKLRILVYSSREAKKRREEKLDRIYKGDFDILVTTTSFLSRRFEVFKNLKFDVVIVDDADSLLKNSRNIDRVLQLIGFTEEDIENAFRLIKVKIELIVRKLGGDNEKVEKLLEEYERLQLAITEARTTRRIGQLAIASATGRQCGLKPKMFRELLDFEVGGIHDYMRNIVEAYYIGSENELFEKLVSIIRKLGSGGLVFVSRDLGASKAREIVERLRENGIKAELALSGKRVVKKLEKGEAEVLVGVSSYYGVIVRGIDLPKQVKYAVFYGVPKNKVLLRKALESPRRALQVMTYVAPEDEDCRWLQRIINKMTPGELLALRIALSNNTVELLGGKLRSIAEKMVEIIEKLVEKTEEIVGKEPGSVLSIGTGVIKRGADGRLYFISPDPLTYIQASGRTSRFLDDRMTMGFSLILETNKEMLEAMAKRIRNYVSSFDPVPLDSVDLGEVRRLLEASRRGGEGARRFKPARSVLIVVESPNKARTIASFFGRPSRRRFPGTVAYEVPIVDPETLDTYLAIIVATRGHMYDLVIDSMGVYGVLVEDGEVIPIFAPIKKCVACGHTFASASDKCPRCESSGGVKSSVSIAQALRKLALETEEVLIATDPDVEGEKIAWDVALTVKPFNNNIKRIEFHEVTREAILQALRNPREVNMNRVRAQVVRRVTDRWIGFSLSEELWKRFDKNWLGAGRVQTPVLGWIISRFGEWKKTRGYWVLVKTSVAPHIRVFYEDKEAASKVVDEIKSSGRIRIKEYRVQTEKINPPPPFTTDELLYEAGRVLGFSAGKTMMIAQNLFEAGLITYHRTDSTRISPKGMSIAREYFKKEGIEQLCSPRAWGEGGAHEAIRPVKPISAEELRRAVIDGSIRVSVQLTDDHYRLYDLIFRRFMASQAKHSIVKKITMKVLVGKKEVEVTAITDEDEKGFLSILGSKLYSELNEWIGKGVLPVDSAVMYRGSLVSLYTQGDVVRLMRDRGLGRPSTYAKIIESIRRHGYVIVSKKAKYLVPTKTGIIVHEFLTNTYRDLVSEERTRMLEAEMSLIEEGKVDYRISLMNLLQELESAGLPVIDKGLTIIGYKPLSEALG